MTQVNGLKVVSAARKLIALVPATTRVAQFPEGCVISEYGQNNAAPVITVQNRTDGAAGGGSYQGADAEAGVIIMNEVPEATALELLGIYDGTIEGLDRMVARAYELGCGDIYTTKKSFVETKLTPAGKMVNQYTGIVKRDDRDVCTVYKDGAGVYQIVIKEPRQIELDILLRTYVCADGSPIDPAAIPTVA